MIGISVDLTDLKDLQLRLTAAHHRIANRSKPHKEIKNRQNARWQTNWSSQGNEYGKKWAPLADATVRDRRKLQKRGLLVGGARPAGPPLLRTGKLQGDLRASWQTSIVASGITAWTFEGYLIYHHYGFNNIRAGKFVAPRVLFPLDDKDEREIRKIIEDWVHSSLTMNHLV